MLSVELEDIEADVYYHDRENERYFVKVIFHGTGMFINSFSVMPSKFEGQGYWVQAPKYRRGGGWANTVEFDRSYPLWGIIERKALEAVDRYKNDPLTEEVDEIFGVPERPISLDDIPNV